MTTYGSRIASAHLTLESIGRGAVRPSRLILWLDDRREVVSPNEHLRRLQARGLEILLTEDYGPHKKYYPFCRDHDLSLPLVTADDDVLYPRRWLRDLIDAHHTHPDDTICHRAHKKGRRPGGGLAPYQSWAPCLTADAAEDNFATGVSGILYPPRVLERLRELGDSFLTVCPRTDDVWLHYATIDSECTVRQVRSTPVLFPQIAAAQVVNLAVSNGDGGENDAALGRTAAHFGVAADLAGG